jgi:streptogramin lyase
MWFTEPFAKKVGRISTIPFVNEYSTSTGYTTPNAMTSTTGASGTLWYTETSSSGYADTLGKMTTSGTVTDYNVTPTGYTFFKMSSIVADSAGLVWFSGCGNNGSSYVMVAGFFDPSTGTTTANSHDTGAGCAGYAWTPGPITVGPDGNVWLTVNSSSSSTSSWVERLTSSATVGSSYSMSGSSSPQWTSVTAGPSNTLWLTDSRNNALDKLTISATGTISSVNTYTVPTANSSPYGITLGSDGNLWFTESTKIGTVTTSGSFAEYSTPSGYYPTSIATGSDGGLWFVEQNNYGNAFSVGRISTSGSITEYAVGVNDLRSITRGPDNAMWFTEPFAKKVGRIGY